MAKSAGKIIIRPMGEYQSTETYRILDVVTRDNRVYIAKVDYISGVTPTPEDNSKWVMLVDGKTDVEGLKALMNQTVAVVQNDLDAYKTSTNATLAELQDQIDGAITTWFYEYEPEPTNVPASNWTTTEEKNTHLGDVFYDTTTGYRYRWTIQADEYVWLRIADTDVTKALLDANVAKTDAAEALTKAEAAVATVAALEAKLNSLTFEVDLDTGKLEWSVS